MGVRHFSLSPLLEGLDLDLNTRYQLAHLTADITMLLNVLRTSSGHAGFPPPLRYRIRPANVCIDTSTQTDPLPDPSSSYQTDDDVAFSDLGSDHSPPFSPASPEYSPPFSPASPEYSPPYTSAGYPTSPGCTPFYHPFSPTALG
ncbi:DNA-directed RNA polymerase II subunit RPB1-like [Ictalurus punctatus]|uniref:DNA-directed RNA polymerase II subunit RPB1-like n=1 Tax=Ictalurus punctatus TaxID=7998 RepID=A0A9F7TI30_ICTPU|nr:DNA-directed RNA polymerase II subunit RPB1-like [Ictalurus punctatus]